MLPRTFLPLAGLAAVVLLAGCGAGGGGSPAAPGGQPAATAPQVPGGQLVVETAATADYRSVAFGTSAVSEHVFVGIYRAWFNRVEYRPNPGWLCGRSAASSTALVVSREDGSGLHQIASFEFGGSLSSADWPRWSPDGAHIAAAPASYRIVVCDADGSNMRKVVEGEGFASIKGLSWSPSGRIYYALQKGGVWDIYSVYAFGSDPLPAQVTSDTDEDRLPDVSPDGRWLVWCRRASSSDDWDLVMMPIAGNPATDIKTFASSSADELSPRWSPDGRFVAYLVSSNSLTGDLYVRDVAIGYSRQLTNTQDVTGLDWSSDGRYILFLRGNDLYRIPFDGSPGDEELVRAGWGAYFVDCTVASGRRRVLVGPAGSDWGGEDPPFGTKRPGVILVLSDSGLRSAVTFTVPSTDTLIMADRTPPGAQDLVVCEARAGAIYRVLEDNGPGEPKNSWLLGTGASYPGAVLVLIRTRTGKTSSVVALWDQVGGAAVSSRPAVALDGDRLTVTGYAMRVYDGSGRLVTGERPVNRAVFDAATGRPLAP